jgi:cyclin H
LKLCKNNTGKVPGTKAYLAKRVEEERKTEEKRAKKADTVQKAMAGDGGPFGNQLKKSHTTPVDYDNNND